MKKFRKFLFFFVLPLVTLSLILNATLKKDTKSSLYPYDTSQVVNSPSKIEVEMANTGPNTQAQEENVLAAKNEEGENNISQKREVRFGIVVSDYTNKTGQIDNLENLLGVKFSTIGIYKQFGLPTNRHLPEEDLTYIKKTGKSLLITWEPWDPEDGLDQAVDYLREIGEGKHDAYITDFARQIKSFSNPAFLRFAHEMNGNWYPWGGKSSEYISAYRRIFGLFQRERVSNVKFIWSINHQSVPIEPINQVTKYFPGEDCVDIIGLDGFNFGTSGADSVWRSFEEIFQPAYLFATSTYPDKPIIITEVASTEFGGDKSQWVSNMFVSLLKMPRIEEIIWFSLLKETDWRIDSSSSSIQAFKNNLIHP